MMEKRCRGDSGLAVTKIEERLMNKQAIALLSLGHFLIDFCQGVVPALVPFLVDRAPFFVRCGGGSGLRDQCDVVGRAARFSASLPIDWLWPGSCRRASSWRGRPWRWEHKRRATAWSWRRLG